MDDMDPRTRLIGLAPPSGSPVWDILRTLARKPENELRAKLRSHEDAGFSSKNEAEDMREREALDLALDALTLLEIGYQAGYVTPDEYPIPELDTLAHLFRSEAFFRFTAVYHYFGVRFLAARVLRQPWNESNEHIERLALRRNDRIFPLVTPPSLKVSRDDKSAAIEQWQAKNNFQDTQAAAFLDGFCNKETRRNLELWLRCVRPDLSAQVLEYFQQITSEMEQWALEYARFLLRLHGLMKPEDQEGSGILEEAPNRGWVLCNPFAARINLTAVYWIGKLLRVEISSEATVVQREPSWLSLISLGRQLQGNDTAANQLRRAEAVLRSSLAITCDLVQNAVGLSKQKEEDLLAREHGKSDSPETTCQWRKVLDAEFRAISSHREMRSFRQGLTPPVEPDGKIAGDATSGWSERFVNGFALSHVVGLAFSGGGIRSATFNLGVLQGLQELDMLNWVDYLSTVSGGGFIGSWLLGNVKRSRHWLTRRNSWDESIAHLRAYANYLTPRSGILSGDTWSLGALWLRNTVLIQLAGLTWLLAGLLVIVLTRFGFDAAVNSFHRIGVIPILMMPGWWERLGFALSTLTLVLLVRNFAGGKGPTSSTRTVQICGTVPAWISSSIGGAYILSLSFDLLKNCAPKENDCWDYSKILMGGLHYWPHLICYTGLCFFLVSSLSLFRARSDAAASQRPDLRTTAAERAWFAFGNALWISPICTFGVHLCLSALLYVYAHAFAVMHPSTPTWLAIGFVTAPAGVLASYSIGVLLLVGLSGRMSNESQREWWTRYGAWILIYASIGLLLSTIVFYGPPLIEWLFGFAGSHWKAIKIGAVLGWVGTIFSGLFAGKSSKTAGDNPNKSKVLELLANVGGLLFVLAALLGTAALLNAFLSQWQPAISLDPSTVLPPVYSSTAVLCTLGILIGCGALFSWFFEINIFSINQLYRNRLVRCYLGATRWATGLRNPQPFTTFDFNDDLSLADFKDDFRGPFPLLNCSLNLSGCSEVALNTRHSASFTLSPLYCGSDRKRVGYAPTCTGEGKKFADGVRLGQAVSVSGAAASPNMGYNTRPLVALLLTMFNVRLGWWFPNPGRSRWNARGLTFSLWYLFMELLGTASDRRKYLNVSDGGHFENLGIYELVRRKCKVIIASDAECDEDLAFGGLGNVIRLCEVDFGAVIDIDVSSLRKNDKHVSRSHCAVGTIRYGNGATGHLIYLKANLTGDEDASVAQYHASHPTFPHQSTANQFYTEDQFESYRRLGLHSVRVSFRGVNEAEHPVTAAEKMADMLVASSCANGAFLKHTRRLDGIWERFRRSARGRAFFSELMDGDTTDPNPVPSTEDTCLGLELFQLMEDVFMDLRLDDFWEHPDNRGWAMLFMGWARSLRLRHIWKHSRQIMGIRFEYFCEARLGLQREDPVLRVRPLTRSV